MTHISVSLHVRRLSGIACAAAVAIAAGPAIGDKATDCHNYAVTAAKLSTEAINLGCGFKPPVWSTDSTMHFNWCMQGNNSIPAPSQNVKRSVDLQACAAQKSAEMVPALAVCAIYATEATSAATQAEQLGCGFTGGRWSTDYGGHLAWCMSGANPVVMVGETASRASQLAGCVAAKGN